VCLWKHVALKSNMNRKLLRWLVTGLQIEICGSS
jgi:hypothetical protein